MGDQSSMKVILEFPEMPDRHEKDTGSEAEDAYEASFAYEESIRQEIRTLLTDMLREHFKKNTMAYFTENASEGEGVL